MIYNAAKNKRICKKALMKIKIYKRWWIARKRNKFRNVVSNSAKKELDSQPVHHEKYLKTKIETYEGKISTNSYDDGKLKQVLIPFFYHLHWINF